MKKTHKPTPSAVPALEIVICIKPVPDPRKWDKLKLDPETMLLTRADIPAVINTLDRNAIEQALLFKAQFGGSVRVVTMAPPSAEEQLREALAMGCDQAFLLTDRAFAGADTLATARTLAAAIRKIGRFDLIFCGGYTLDGSTAQVGPQLAELLDLPDLPHAVRLGFDEGVLTVECKQENGNNVVQCDLPALVTLDREANVPRLPGMLGIRRAAAAEITTWNAADLGLEPATVGLAGSPTQMLNVFTPTIGRKGEMLQGGADEMARQLVARLHADKIIQ